MKTNFAMVQEFHQKFELPQPSTPCLLRDGVCRDFSGDIKTLIEYVENHIRRARHESDVFGGRVQMMLEELREFIDAHEKEDIATAADSLVDLAYFVFGTAVMMGLPWDALFAEVHRANMAKVRVSNAEESKRLNKLDVRKPDGWQPPDFTTILREAGL